ncbi:MAG: ABC transporter permease [Planctomycetes bacterium]|nr:ABC transporter permease [Planctomycetota bacterium]
MFATVTGFLETIGLTWFVPPLKIAAGIDRRYEARRFVRMIGLPGLAIGLFLAVWWALSTQVVIKGHALPGPREVYAAGGRMVGEYQAARRVHAEWLRGIDEQVVANPTMSRAEVMALMPDTAAPTYLDQIGVSLKTVFTGFLLAAITAIPLGILCGMNRAIFEMVNPFIQVFRPVSPIAWLPIVGIVVSAGMADVAANSFWAKSYVISAVVVCLCSLWPILINTAGGVANVERDYLNVARVLNLGWVGTVWKVVLPAALPQIFNGLRLSIGVGWMVLIAAETLSQNPGLGKFVWDMYQSSNDDTLAYIMIAVLTIGVIGFVLDRMMIALQRLVSPGVGVQVR